MATLHEKLVSIKSQLEALITYSNETTAAGDTTVGNCIKTLCDGFGTGSGSESEETSTDQSIGIIDRTVTSIENSNATTIGKYAFSYCQSLISAIFENVETIREKAFVCCYALNEISFPSCTSIETYVFNNCTSLEEIDFPKITSIGASSFAGCALKHLILRSSTLCTYSTSSSSYDPKSIEKIYVPSDLLESYQAATNWKRLSDKFVALEDYTTDGTTTGEMNRDSDGNITSRSE